MNLSSRLCKSRPRVLIRVQGPVCSSYEGWCGSNSNGPIIMVVCRVRDVYMMPHHEYAKGCLALFKMSLRPRLDALSMQYWTHGCHFYMWTVMNGNAFVCAGTKGLWFSCRYTNRGSFELKRLEKRLKRDVYYASPPALTTYTKAFWYLRGRFRTLLASC